MIRKVLISVIIFLTIFTVYGDSCYFDSMNESCERLSKSYNSFSLINLDETDFQRYEIEVYNVNNPQNKLKFTQDNFDINQLSPFLESGVYVFDVFVYDLAGNIVNKKFEYIFDNLEPMPPVVPLYLDASSNSVAVKGICGAKSEVVAQIGGKTTIQVCDSNGEFSLSLTGLNSGVNYVKFYSKRGTLTSDVVERVIYGSSVNSNSDSVVSSISIDDLNSLNDRTIGSVTTKRNFYVQGKLSGNNLKGAKVYVNGFQTLSDESGTFGAFVLLNEGENEIEVKSGSVTKTYADKINYVNFNFKILELDYEKIVSQNSVNVKGKTNFDYPIMVFLNGNFVSRYSISENSFSINLENLNPGKNYFEIRGVNNQIYKKIVYYDAENPKIENLNFNKRSSADKLVFKITDDIGINVNSVTLSIGNVVLDKDNLIIKDEFYIFDISQDVEFGNSNYVVSGEDLVGKRFDLSGQVDINSNYAQIDKIKPESSIKVLGNYIFIKSGQNQFSILPSKNIVFKSVYLDGVEQTNYEILKNNEIVLDMKIKEKTGTLEFNYVDSNYVEYKEKYNYVSDLEKPRVELDFVQFPFTKNKVMISGEIISENFEWSSLNFNSQKTFSRYGNYFEANIDLDKSGHNDLVVSGYDYSKNVLNMNYPSILYRDSKLSEVLFSQNRDVGKDGFLSGSIFSSEQNFGNLNYMTSYDGFKMNKVYLNSGVFKLPLQQREGYRSMNLNGFELSSAQFSNLDSVDVKVNNSYYGLSNSIPLEIYLNGNDKYTTNEKAFVQGQIISSSAIKTITASKGSCKFDDFSFVCSADLVNGENPISVTITNNQGETATKSFTINKVEGSLIVSIESLFGEGIYETSNKYFVLSNDVSVRGKVSQDAIIKILIDGKEKLVNRQDGEFTLGIDLEEELNANNYKEIIIQLEAQDEFGVKSLSQQVKLYYYRVLDAFATVLLE